MLPMAVAGTLMDLPEPDWDDLVQWTGMAAAPDDPVFMIRNAHATLAIAHHQLFKYFSEQYEARKGAEGDDAIGVLMTMRDGELTPEEVVVNCYSLLLGANATTPHTVAGTVLALLERPEQFRPSARTPPSSRRSSRRACAGLPRRAASFATRWRTSNSAAASCPAGTRSPSGSAPPTATRTSSRTRTASM